MSIFLGGGILTMVVGVLTFWIISPAAYSIPDHDEWLRRTFSAFFIGCGIIGVGAAAMFIGCIFAEKT